MLIKLAFIFCLAINLNLFGKDNCIENEGLGQTVLQPLKNNGKYWPESARFLVIVNQYDGDVSWACRLKFPYIIYEKEKPEKEPFSARNKAKAETNLLKFIAEFYDDLPENIIQVYQYEFKDHHEGSLVDILNSKDFELNYAKSKTSGFLNFNKCIWHEEPPVDGMVKSGFWKATMESVFGSIYDYGNFLYGKKACAQFVVSRDRILSLPREFYSNMYFWLVNNTIGDVNTGYDQITKTRLPTPLDYHYNSNYFTSRCMEKTWELIFTAYKPGDEIAIPILVKNSASEKPIRYISARYGAKRYYRDVTEEVVYQFFRANQIVIPAAADFNEFFTDVIPFVLKTLIITIDDKEYKIEESRLEDIVIKI